MNILNINARHVYGLDNRTLVAVLTEDGCKRQAVYLGACQTCSHTAYEDIALHGTKLAYQEALCHFPGLIEKNYRL